MDLGIRGPFLELFRRGDTPREVRLLAARGGLAPPADEQLALLLILADDPDVEVAVSATETMDGIPEAAPDSAGAPKMLSQLPVIDRIKLAMKGTREQRTSWCGMRTSSWRRR